MQYETTLILTYRNLINFFISKLPTILHIELHQFRKRGKCFFNAEIIKASCILYFHASNFARSPNA